MHCMHQVIKPSFAKHTLSKILREKIQVQHQSETLLTQDPLNMQREYSE